MRIEGNEGERTDRPFEYADPRSLSEAWYEALYGRRPVRSHASAPHEERAASGESSGSSAGTAAHADSAASEAAGPSAAGFAAKERSVAERRESRAALDLDRERREASLRRAPEARKPAASHDTARNDVDVRDAEGNEIRLLLAQRGERVDVVAVTDPAAGARVAEALESARLALGARGIELRASVQERGER